MTDKVQFTSNDESVVEVTRGGLVKAIAPGETTIMVRSLGQAVAARIFVVTSAAGADYPAVPANNYIDRYIFEKLRRTNVVPSEIASDQHFLRRKRHNRLISLVLERAPHLGAGIDESTALIVDRTGKLTYVAYMPHLGMEPNYDEVIEAAKAALYEVGRDFIPPCIWSVVMKTKRPKARDVLFTGACHPELAEGLSITLSY